MPAAKPVDALLDGLRTSLRAHAPACSAAEFVPLGDTGLAHWHVRLVGTGLLARIPKQSQMQLAAADNLAYQRACFERAAASGHTPRLHHVLPPGDALPRGALIVQEIIGRPARLPADLAAIMRALAGIHRCALPAAAARAPLRDAADPLADLMAEIRDQGRHLEGAGLDQSVRSSIDREVDAFAALVATAARPPKALISFDAHPGNFLVTSDGRAVLVDLEKARYAYPPLDLAHATLYTSTTWDVASSAELSVGETARAYGDWSAAIGAPAAASAAWHVPLRRAMWLWSVTWCAKWRALSRQSAPAQADGEDWSSGKSDAALITHVRGRVDCYLSRPIVDRIRGEFAALDLMLAQALPIAIRDGGSA